MAVYTVEFDSKNNPFEVEVTQTRPGIKLNPKDMKRLEDDLNDAIDGSDGPLPTINGTRARRCRSYQNGTQNNMFDISASGQTELQHVEIEVGFQGDGVVHTYPPKQSGIVRLVDSTLTKYILPIQGQAFRSESFPLPPHAFILFAEQGSQANSLRLRRVVAHRDLEGGFEPQNITPPSTKQRPLAALPLR